MKENNFDETAWGDYENESRDLDLDKNWSTLESSLVLMHKEDRRKRFLIWFFSLAGVICLGFLINLWYQKETNSTPDVVVQSEITDTNTSNDNSILKQETSNPKVNLSENNNSNIENSNVNSQTKYFSNKQIKDNNIASHKVSDTKVKSDNHLLSGMDQLSSKNKTKEQKESNNLALISNLPNSKIIDKASFKTTANLPNEVNSDIVENSPALESNRHLLNFIELPILISYIEHTSARNDLISFPLVMSNKIKPIHFTNNWISFSGSYGLSNYKSKSNSIDYNNFNSKRNSIEKGQDGINFELLFGKTIFQNGRLQFGIQYSQLNHKIQNSYLRTVSETLKDQVVQIDKYEDGRISETRMDVQAFVVKSYEDVYYNQFSTLSIPILIGFQKEILTKGFVYLDGGIQCSVYSSTKGFLLSSLPTSIYDKLDSYSFKKSGVLGFQIQGGYSLRINKYFESSLGLQYSQDLNSRLKSSEAFSQRNSYFGLQLKLARKF